MVPVACDRWYLWPVVLHTIFVGNGTIEHFCQKAHTSCISIGCMQSRFGQTMSTLFPSVSALLYGTGQEEITPRGTAPSVHTRAVLRSIRVPGLLSIVHVACCIILYTWYQILYTVGILAYPINSRNYWCQVIVLLRAGPSEEGIIFQVASREPLQVVGHESWKH